MAADCFRKYLRRSAPVVLASISWVLQSENIHAQVPLEAPNLDLRASGTIWAMLRQPSGALLFTGQFDSVDGSPRPGIARLKADGRLDEVWNPPLASAWNLLRSCADDIFVNGAISTENSEPITLLHKLVGSTGALDPSWEASEYAYAAACAEGGQIYLAGYDRIYRRSTVTGEFDPSWSVWAARVNIIEPAPDGHVYVAGAFDSINGLPRDRLARLSATGQVDPIWVAQLPGTLDDAPQALAVAADGGVFVGGSFGIVKLSSTTGAPVPSWKPSSGDVRSLAVADNGSSIFVGGWFSKIGGQPRRNFARLSSIDGTALPDWQASPNGAVLSIAAAPDGSVFLGGGFDVLGGRDVYGLARLSASGNVRPPIVETLAPGKIHSLASRADGSIIAGGDFVKVDGQPRRHLLRLQPDASLDPEWTPKLLFEPGVLAVDGDAFVYAAGGESSEPGRRAIRIAKISSADKGDIDTNWNVVTDGWLHVLAVGSDHAVYLGGLFDSVNDSPRRGIAKLSASTGAVIAAWDAQIEDGSVNSITIGDNGKLYLGGWFTAIAGFERPWAARLSSDSAALDTSWNPELPGAAYASALDTDGNLYVGGQSSMAQQAPFPFAFKLSEQDGSILRDWRADIGIVWDATPQGYRVDSIVVDADEAVYMGGLFGIPGSIDERRLARFSAQNGLVDLEWHPYFFGADRLAIATVDNRLYVGGDFSAVSGKPRQALSAFEAARPNRLFASSFEASWPLQSALPPLSESRAR